ncbi:MAG: twin-arginine translocase subunit TatC [Bacillota bacterium]
MSNNKNGTMPILEHISELRLRLVISAGALLVAVGISFANVELFRGILTRPLGDMPLIYLSPPEAFTANLKLSLFTGLVLALPVLLYELSAYIFPGLTSGEKKFYLAVLAGIIVLFSAGVIFAFHVVFPYTLSFFLQFADAQLEPHLTISDYLAFVLSFHIAFGAVFQLPLLTWALGKIGLLSTSFLRRHRKIAILIMLIMASIITPPDIISQAIMILPLLFLYELGIFMVMISERKQLDALSD